MTGWETGYRKVIEGKYFWDEFWVQAFYPGGPYSKTAIWEQIQRVASRDPIIQEHLGVVRAILESIHDLVEKEADVAMLEIQEKMPVPAVVDEGPKSSRSASEDKTPRDPHRTKRGYIRSPWPTHQKPQRNARPLDCAA